VPRRAGFRGGEGPGRGEATKAREIYRLHEWLLACRLTGVITANADSDETSSVSQQPFRSMLFMVDCVVILNHSVTLGVTQRNLRVQKYRGSAFDENSPMVKDALLPVSGCSSSGRWLSAGGSRSIDSAQRLPRLTGAGLRHVIQQRLRRQPAGQRT
jgi:circadian clock protein KaiC